MFFQLRQFLRFYAAAVTKYQLHSPFVYDLAMAVLEDTRWFYAFDDVELLRQAALDSDVVLTPSRRQNASWLRPLCEWACSIERHCSALRCVRRRLGTATS